MFEIEFCKDILILILLQVTVISRTLFVPIVKTALGGKRVFWSLLQKPNSSVILLSIQINLISPEIV